MVGQHEEPAGGYTGGKAIDYDERYGEENVR